jgi:hypothetical protein
MEIHGLLVDGRRFTIAGRLAAAMHLLVKEGNHQRAAEMVLRVLYRDERGLPDGVLGPIIQELVFDL